MRSATFQDVEHCTFDLPAREYDPERPQGSYIHVLVTEQSHTHPHLARCEFTDETGDVWLEIKIIAKYIKEQTEQDDSEDEGLVVEEESVQEPVPAATRVRKQRKTASKRSNQPELQVKWVKEDFQPQLPECSVQQARVDLHGQLAPADPLGWLHLLLPDALFSGIAKQTGLYARQKRAAQPDEWHDAHPSARQWSEPTASDIKKLFGLNLLLGHVEFPEVEHYWSVDPLYHHPFFGSIMSRQEYEQLMRYLHLADNTRQKPYGQPGHDPLHKVKPMVRMLRKNLLLYYIPGPHLTIDEAMIAYKGRLRFKVYNPDKPIKRGIKVYCLNEAGTGALLAFIVYTGSTTYGTTESDEGSDDERVPGLLSALSGINAVKTVKS